MSLILDGRHVGKITPEITITKNMSDGYTATKTFRNVIRADVWNAKVQYVHNGAEIKDCKTLWDFSGFGSSIIEAVENDAQWFTKCAKITAKSTLRVQVVGWMERRFYLINNSTSLSYCLAQSIDDLHRYRKSRLVLFWDSHDGWIVPKKRITQYIERRKKREAIVWEMAKPKTEMAIFEQL
jgi:hypothetical protein